ncbi:MAG: HipA domain-containing protein [Luteibacter sp.]
MATRSKHVPDLIDILPRQGPSSARELGAALGVSQPTVSRALAAAGSRVVRWGQTNRARYGARRNVRGLGSEWPVFRVDSQGRPHEFGQLTALHGSGTVVLPASQTDWLRGDFVDGHFPGVPWFLDDQRPQGFLGRQFAQRWSSDPGLSRDILQWDDDAVLAALLLHGDDGPGNFVLGEVALRQALQSTPDAMPSASRERLYARMAEAALAGESVGSSAAGEQPKFTTTIDDGNGSPRHVIVKFSEPVESSAAARRWADLLISEHIASEFLAERGNASSRTELVWSEGRACLEVTRFDRIGAVWLRSPRGVMPTTGSVIAGPSRPFACNETAGSMQARRSR